MANKMSYGVLAAVAAVVAIAAFLAGVFGAPLIRPTGGTTNSSNPTAPTHLYLSVNANPMIAPSDADQVEPANISVPSHTLLIITITNYDPGVNTVPAVYQNVKGALGGVEYVNGSASGVGSVAANSLSHTFTLPDGSYAGFNIPIPAASDVAPSVVTFEAYFNNTGVFEWKCMTPCDDPSMSAHGYMEGMFTVE